MTVSGEVSGHRSQPPDRGAWERATAFFVNVIRAAHIGRLVHATGHSTRIGSMGFWANLSKSE